MKFDDLTTFFHDFGGPGGYVLEPRSLRNRWGKRSFRSSGQRKRASAVEERPSHEVGCDGLVVGVPGEVGKLQARRVNVARRTIGELDADGVLSGGTCANAVNDDFLRSSRTSELRIKK